MLVTERPAQGESKQIHIVVAKNSIELQTLVNFGKY